MKLKEKILYELEHDPKSIEELQLTTGKEKNNILHRISDLRKDGYNIELKRVEIKKYVLSKKSNSIKILEYIEKNNLYKMDIPIRMLANKLNITEDETKSGIAKLLNDYKILQINKDTIIFFGK